MAAAESVTDVRGRCPAWALIPAVVAVVAAVTAIGIEPLSAQVPRAPQVPEDPPAAAAVPPSALAEIDRLAAHTAEFLHRYVSDRAGATIWILPFVTDTGVATRLGHRLQSAVHLRMLSDYYRLSEIRVVERHPLPSPAPVTAAYQLPAAARSAIHALELEIQPFRDTLRVVLRVLGSGAVSAGEWVDLPVSEELQELLDGTGAAAGRGRRSSPPTATVPAAEPGAEPETPRTPLPSAITVDRGQQRYTTHGEDWVTLQVPAPGFYLLEGRSIAGPLTLSLHYDRTGPPVVTARADAHAGAGGDGAGGGLPRGVDLKLGIFSGPRRSYVRISSASQEHVAYYLRLRPLNPARRFADGTVHPVSLERGTGFQTLRVFRSSVYRVVGDTDEGRAELRVFSVPSMRPVAPVAGPRPEESGTLEPVAHRYDLAAGDYLVEVSAAPAAPAARLCWAASDSTGGCAG